MGVKYLVYLFVRMRLLVSMIVLLVLAFVFKFGVYASGFNLKSISEVDTGGRQISRWWYSGTKPVFHGEATPNAEVIIDIDGNAMQINADSSGNWDFAPVAELSAGDHQVSLKSGGSEINFTLTLGVDNVDWNAVGSGSAQTMPTAGNSWPTIMLFVGGLGVAVMGGKIVLHANKTQ
jgi:hypothetical protein